MKKGNGKYYILSTKTKAGARLLPMTDEVYRCFVTILEPEKTPKGGTHHRWSGEIPLL